MKKSNFFDVIIIGGGLAGLTCALHLSKFNKQVLLIEKNTYPKHKVCGEYISNEVLPYLRWLEIDPIQEGAKEITKIEITTTKGSLIQGSLPLGGFGMSRYYLDNLLVIKAQKKGAQINQDTVEKINYNNNTFSISTKSGEKFTSKIVVGAFGKRSNLDIQMNRKFIQKKSPYLAVKTHVKGNFSDDTVALHNFKGGYCGISKVENGSINLCYIANYSSFKKYKNIQEFQENIVYKNVFLKKLFKESRPVFDTPLTISQISFQTKQPVEKHMIMCGDSAGMIHPLCGNGMGMAIRSAQMASENILLFLNGTINRKKLEKNYLRSWNKEFKGRLKVGHAIAWLFRKQTISQLAYSLLKISPFLLPMIIRLTHGKPLKPS